MAYPKPLSEKRIQKMYAEAKINEAQSEFLHNFFTAAANLYGVVTVGELWEVYKEYSQMADVPKLQRKAIVAFSEIARRENNPYYVFEINEVYAKETPSVSERIVVLRELIMERYRKFAAVYQIDELSAGKKCYVPKDLLSYVKPVMTKEQKDIIQYLGELKITASSAKDRYGRAHSCPDKGKCLKEAFSCTFVEDGEIRLLEMSAKGKYGASAQESLNKYIEGLKEPVSVRLLKRFLWLEQAYAIQPGEVTVWILDEIEGIGVELTDTQIQELIGKFTLVHNTTHLYLNKGWAPSNLRNNEPQGGPPVISFGQGIREAIIDTTMDREELIRKLSRMGLSVEDL